MDFVKLYRQEPRLIPNLGAALWWQGLLGAPGSPKLVSPPVVAVHLCGRPPAWPHTCVSRPAARPLTCVAADVNPQRPAAGEPLAAVRAGFLLLSCVRLGGAGVEET